MTIPEFLSFPSRRLTRRLVTEAKMVGPSPPDWPEHNPLSRNVPSKRRLFDPDPADKPSKPYDAFRNAGGLFICTRPVDPTVPGGFKTERFIG
jgi:hypothetical protein